jgi:hypothetical protein
MLDFDSEDELSPASDPAGAAAAAAAAAGADDSDDDDSLNDDPVGLSTQEP